MNKADSRDVRSCFTTSRTRWILIVIRSWLLSEPLSFTTFTLKLLKTIFIFAKTIKIIEKQRGQTRLNDELFDILFISLNCPLGGKCGCSRTFYQRLFRSLFNFNLTEQIKKKENKMKNNYWF